MIEVIYRIYKEQKRIIQLASDSDSEEFKAFIEELKLANTILEEGCSEYKQRHEREKRIQSSFTAEQIDFICCQIGDWYLEWKHRIIINLDKGTHKLGYAKEKMKELICG